jgi:hypothetical protein
VWLYAIHIRDLALPGVPPWRTAGSCCGSSRPAVFLLSIPFAIRQPVLGQYLWLLALVSALVIRRLEPPRPTRQPPRTATLQAAVNR